MDRIYLSPGNKILVSALLLEEHDNVIVPQSLAIKAWKEFPEAFGMVGFESQYPDSWKVITIVTKKGGLIEHNLIAKHSSNLYLTPNGRRVAWVCCNECNIRTDGPDIDEEKFLERTLESVAFTKIKEELLSELEFHEACTFWGIPIKLVNHQTIEQALVAFGIICNELQELMQRTTNKELLCSNGWSIVKRDLDTIEDTNHKLQKHFRTVLECLKIRSRG